MQLILLYIVVLCDFESMFWFFKCHRHWINFEVKTKRLAHIFNFDAGHFYVGCAYLIRWTVRRNVNKFHLYAGHHNARPSSVNQGVPAKSFRILDSLTQTLIILRTMLLMSSTNKFYTVFQF